MATGDLLESMAHLAKNVHWRVNVTDREAAPWFGDYRGRQGVLAFFEAMTNAAEVTTYDILSIVGDGDVVVVWLHLAFAFPDGRQVDMDETQVWVFEDGKVKEMEMFVDTLAIASAFA